MISLRVSSRSLPSTAFCMRVDGAREYIGKAKSATKRMVERIIFDLSMMYWWLKVS